METFEGNLRVIGKNAFTPLVAGTNLSIGNYVAKLAKHEPELPDFALWCVDLPLSIAEWVTLVSTPKKQRHLIRYEPSVVMPRSHSRTFRNLFATSIDVGRPAIDLSSNITRWPQAWGEPTLTSDVSRSQRIAVINGDKLSFVDGEMYSLRRQCLKEMGDLDLYGQGWNKGLLVKTKTLLAEFAICVYGGRAPRLKAAKYWFEKPAHYFGSPANKRETLATYKYSLVIENSLEFLTEKLFDCLFSGTIPIYVGPRIEKFDIPADLVIQAEPNVQAIQEGVARAATIDYQTWQTRVIDWLKRDETRNSWSSDAVFQKIFETLTASDAI